MYSSIYDNPGLGQGFECMFGLNLFAIRLMHEQIDGLKSARPNIDTANLK